MQSGLQHIERGGFPSLPCEAQTSARVFKPYRPREWCSDNWLDRDFSDRRSLNPDNGSPLLVQFGIGERDVGLLRPKNVADSGSDGKCPAPVAGQGLLLRAPGSRAVVENEDFVISNHWSGPGPAHPNA